MLAKESFRIQNAFVEKVILIRRAQVFATRARASAHKRAVSYEYRSRGRR
jgi:hypothetical protein